MTEIECLKVWLTLMFSKEDSLRLKAPSRLAKWAANQGFVSITCFKLLEIHEARVTFCLSRISCYNVAVCRVIFGNLLYN